jgi:carotenoid cleavage dioxygenase-like enzyme
VYSNLLERRSELLVIDAEKMQEIARVILPFQIAAQVHGTWAPPEDIPFPV